MDGLNIWWQEIKFTGDTQSLGTAKLVASSPVNSTNLRHSLNMDCLGNISMNRLKGICIINYTFAANFGGLQGIHVEVINERGYQSNTDYQIALSSGQEQFNSMVTLTSDSSYVTTFISRLNDGS